MPEDAAATGAAGELPSVSYVIPVLNEVHSLEHAVSAALAQEYPGRQEVVLALGPSTDGTLELGHALAEADPRVRVVDNPATDIPAGMNRAITAASGEVLIRVDAHAELPPGYTHHMVDALRRVGAANVGGVMRARGRTPFQSAVARAYNSPLGLGGGIYHGGADEGPAESAYLGVFRREVLEEVGLYDESLRRGEDYDLNQRIIAAGHTVWFVPDVEVTYWPRRSWPALARQMYATGTWRGEMVRRQWRTGPRYLAPPALVVALGLSAVGAVASAAGAPVPLTLVLVTPGAYALFLGYAAVAALGGRAVRDRALNAAVLATMHLSWGGGFVKGLLSGAGDTVDRSRVTP